MLTTSDLQDKQITRRILRIVLASRIKTHPNDFKVKKEIDFCSQRQLEGEKLGLIFRDRQQVSQIFDITPELFLEVQVLATLTETKLKELFDREIQNEH